VTTPNVGGAYWTAALTQTPVKTSAYTANPNELVRVDTTSGNVTVTLPAQPAAGTIVAVKMVTLGGSNTVTITAVAGDVFDKAGGSATSSLSLLGQGKVLEYQAGIWMVLADDLPLSQTDLRYLLLTGGTMSGAIAMGSNKITGLTNGSGAQDAAAYGQVLPLAGGTMSGILHAGAGTDSSGSAPILTPSFANATAAQLADTTRDYHVYLAVTTSGTATTVAIGPTSTPANTILPSSSVVAGQLISFRLPAGWYVKWAGTTTAIATQTAIGC